MYRKRTAGYDTDLPPDDLHRPGVDEMLAGLPDRTNGRGPEETEGEIVS